MHLPPGVGLKLPDFDAHWHTPCFWHCFGLIISGNKSQNYHSHLKTRCVSMHQVTPFCFFSQQNPRHTSMHFNTLIDVHCINKKDLFSELLWYLKTLACPKKKFKINPRQLNIGKCNIAVIIKSVPCWSIWLWVGIWLTCGHSSAIWLPCSNFKIAIQP